MPKPRILMICDHAEPIGGSARVMFASREELLRRGIEAVVFGAMGNPSAHHRPEAPVVSFGMAPYQSLGGLSSVRAGIWNEGAQNALREALRPYLDGRSIVHVHSYRDAWTASIFPLLRSHGLPVVFSSHDYSLGCPYGGFLDLRANAACSRRGFSMDCVTAQCQSGSYLRKLGILAKHAATRWRGHFPDCLDCAVFVSERSRDILRPYLGPNVRTELIPNPIDVPHLSRVEAECNEGYLFVGALNPGKDPVTFARAAREAGVQATFIGEGPLADDVRAANPDAVLLGHVSSGQVLETIRRSRGLVFPSKFLETQGMAAYEAVSQGVPVLCAETTTAAAMVQQFRAGLLFRTGDPHDLAQKLREMGSAERVQEASRSGYDTYWANPPTLERHVDRLETLYASLVSEPQG